MKAAETAEATCLRRCSPGCMAWGLGGGLGAVGDLGRVLDACEHSPFATAVRAGFVERALLLYNASHAHDGTQAAAPSSTGEGAQSVAAEALSRIAETLHGHVLHVPLRQALLLLATRRLHPTAGSREQLQAARAACGANGWRPAAELTDVTDGAEQRTVVEVLPSAGAPPLPPFVYVTENVPYDVFAKWTLSSTRVGCTCAEVRTKYCGERCSSCRGRLSECGYGCGCIGAPDKCGNRRLQIGLRKKLSLAYMGANKGWGVKATEAIMRGEFIIEYLGEVISQAESERREKRCDEAWRYFFTLSTKGGTSEKTCYIDAHAVRNLAAFINFSCAPNVEPKGIPSLSGDKRLPRIGFFAKRDIKAGEELTYYRDVSAVSASKWSQLKCECGASQCRGRI